MHPLQIDLTVLSDADIEEKIKELTKKYFTVLNVSPSASTQVLMLLEDYRAEKDAREMKRVEKSRELAGGDQFDGLINIG